MVRETHARSVAKAVSWRVCGSVVTWLIVFILTGRAVLSLGVAAFGFFTKIGLFWAHERLWDRVSFGRRRPAPAVLWFTGLSGSGKSTVADWVAAELERRGLNVERLDGDSMRDLFPGTGFSRSEREDHLRRVGFLASRLERHGVFVVASFVSPYECSRRFVRSLCRSFVEIHVATPLEECERRDVKGLYAKARRGEIERFTGISDPYEAPRAPDVVIDTAGLSPEAAGRIVLRHLHLGRPVLA